MRVLFQGDSITDTGRDRADIKSLGNGYASKAAAALQEVLPDIEWEFINKGISGNRTRDLVERLESDFLEIDADIVSIMIGINDVWRFYDRQDYTPDEKFEADYRTVLSALKTKTKAKIVILECFLLDVPDKKFREDLNKKIDIVRKLAREYADRYIPLDGIMAAASVEKEPTYWAADGVHLTQEGAELVAAHYIETIVGLV